MGTGIVGILLENLPYKLPGQRYVVVCIFVLNLVLFCLFCTISVMRYVLWPQKFMEMINHPVQSLSIGLFSMGYSTLVSLTVYVCMPAWGQSAVILAWVMWWVDIVLSVATCFYVLFVMYGLSLCLWFLWT